MTPPHDHDLERALLGAVLLSTWPPILGELTSDVGLRPEHFDRPAHRAVFAAMLALFDRGEAVDAVTVCAELGTAEPEQIHSLPDETPAVGHWRTYGERLVSLAEWRRRRTALQAMLEASESCDEDAFADAEGKLSAPRKTTESATPEALREGAWEYISTYPEPAFALPFERFSGFLGGGLRRGQVTLLGGWTSHGKSALLDQLLDHVAAHGARTHLYINEMVIRQRSLRTLARSAGVDFDRILRSELRPADWPKLRQAFDSTAFRYGVTQVSGWTAQEIGRDIRRHAWDVAGIDILHLIEHREERDLAAISQAIGEAARRASCHVIATVHLNEQRAIGETVPRPALRDIRGSGMLKNDADNVMFVWREQESEGGAPRPTEDGVLYLSKARDGQLGGITVRFDGAHMRFEERDGRLEAA